MVKSAINITMLSVLFFMSGCAVSPLKELSVHGRTVIDENSPTLNVVFPFNVYYKKTDRGTQDAEGAQISYIYYTFGTGDPERFVSIQKDDSGRTNVYFLGSDDATIKNKLYLEKKVGGFCSVNTEAINEYRFLRVSAYKYIGNTIRVSINIYKSIGSKYDLNILSEDDEILVNEYIGYAKDICQQIFE